ncbi:MAG TPA: hypothetical protein VHC86_05655 [Opitutaceae bacterium]|nr:hypothetical protein [Opitutaceae bacterium]
MKTKRLPSNLFGPALFLLAAAALRAAALSSTAAVQTQPDPASPVISYLKAGTELTPSSDPAAVAPAGWVAIDLPGPFQGYIKNSDFTKGLDAKPGSTVYLAPKDGAGVLTVIGRGDRTEITGLFGSWTQVNLSKKLVGYVNLAPAASGGAPAAPAPVAESAPAPAPAPAPVPAAAGPGTAASSDGGAPLPGVFEGTFTSTHRWIGPKRPYPWQLDDAAGNRIAYLDVSKLQFTDQVDKYAGKSVSVFGSVQPVPGGSDIVIQAESLQLK